MRNGLLFLLSIFLVACETDNQSMQGYIEGDYTYMSSPIGGYLHSLSVKRGQPVKERALLATLNSEPESLKLSEAEALQQQAHFTLKDMEEKTRKEIIQEYIAKREQAEAELTLANARLIRNKKLYNDKVLDKDTYQASLAKVAETQALIKQFNAQIANAKLSSARINAIRAQQAFLAAKASGSLIAAWNEAQKVIHAPNDSRVIDIFYRLGEYVEPGRPILSLLKPDNKHLLFFIPEPKLASLKLGQTVALNCEGCPADEKATVSFIYPKAEYTPPLVYSRKNNAKLVYKVRAKLNNPDKFNPGQPITVSVN